MFDEIIEIMVRKSTGSGFIFFLIIVIVQFGLNKYLKNRQTFFETLNNVVFHYLNISVLAYFLQFTSLPLPHRSMTSAIFLQQTDLPRYFLYL